MGIKDKNQEAENVLFLIKTIWKLKGMTST